jgi:hypothetical protein
MASFSGLLTAPIMMAYLAVIMAITFSEDLVPLTDLNLNPGRVV